MNLVQFKNRATGDLFNNPPHVAMVEPGDGGNHKRDRHPLGRPAQARLAVVRRQGHSWRMSYGWFSGRAPRARGCGQMNSRRTAAEARAPLLVAERGPQLRPKSPPERVGRVLDLVGLKGIDGWSHVELMAVTSASANGAPQRISTGLFRWPRNLTVTRRSDLRRSR